MPLFLILDNIESNVYSIAVDTQAASEELSTASEYQRKAGRRATCLMIILVFVVAVVLIAVCHSTLKQSTALAHILTRSCRHRSCFPMARDGNDD